MAGGSKQKAGYIKQDTSNKQASSQQQVASAAVATAIAATADGTVC